MSQTYLEMRKAERDLAELAESLSHIGLPSPVQRGGGISCEDMDECPGVSAPSRLDDLILCDCGRGSIPQGNGAPDCCASCSRDAMQEKMQAFINAGYELLNVWVEDCIFHPNYARVFAESFDDALADMALIVLPSMDTRPCPVCGDPVAFQDACRRCGR